MTEIERPADPGLSHRLRQLEIVSSFGIFAMQAHGIDEILSEACRVVAIGLETRFAKVLEFQPDRGDFLIRAGVGWRPGVVGNDRLGAGEESPAGHAFDTGEPVTSNELAKENRFRTPAVLAEHGIHRAINVIIRSGDAPPFGVLEGDSTERDAFDSYDTAFLQTLANTLATALAMQDRLAALTQSEVLSRGVLDVSPDCIKILDAEGVVVRLNANGFALMECDQNLTLQGRPWTDIWPENERDKAELALRAARTGTRGHFTGFAPTLRGTPRHWDVFVAPLAVEGAEPKHFVVVSRDVSELVAALDEKDKLLGEKDLLMQEVHHRVKNSLQLVRTLLQLQARTQTNPDTQAQLQEAAGRIMAIGAVHQRLYEGVSVAETDAATYLAGVVADLQPASDTVAQARPILLDVEPIVLPAAEIAPLGLITVELVTNALKYGAGRIEVRVRQVAGGVEVTVSDEGKGFAPDFEPNTSKTLGMRLVSALAKGGRGLVIDRSVPFARVSITLGVQSP